jgi:3-hydroxyacyl-[acyl-carrier-protein] dehydratase
VSAVPLLPAARVVRLGPGEVVAEVAIDPAAPVFQGHYPHFALLPGVFSLEAVHRAVGRHAAETGAAPPRLAEVRSARFAAPVLPGDTLTVDCTVKAYPGGREVTASCSTGRGRVGTYRLRYEDGGPCDGD